MPETAPRATFALRSGEERSSAWVGRRVSEHWEVTAVVGAGTHGLVLEAVDRRTAERVALKVVAPTVTGADLLTGSQRHDALRREAEILGRLRHPNVMRRYDVHLDDEPPCLVLEFVDGETLRQRLDRVGPLGVRRALGRAAQLADAMAHWHDAGLLHRDLKPANLMVEHRTDRLVVIDFGIACAFDAVSEQSRTSTGGVLGSPEYMSPEQCRGGALGPSSDIYALGILLYEMLTGHPPFLAATTEEVVRMQVMEFPEELRRAHPTLRACPILPALEDLVFRCLDKSPAVRGDDACALAGELQSLARELDATLV
jgi:serine/threonine protein kinase